MIANLVYPSKGSEVDNVIIAGKPIIIDGVFREIDEDLIVNNANKRAHDLFENISEDWEKAGSKMVTYQKQGYI